MTQTYRNEGNAQMSMTQTEAQCIARQLRIAFPNNDLQTQQALCLAEEVGEFVQAYRRHGGMARQPGSFRAVREELADVVITAYITAAVLAIDLDLEIALKTAAMWERGWKV